MTRLHTSHQYNYSPLNERQKARNQARKDAMAILAAVVVFALIGVLLAWRG